MFLISKISINVTALSMDNKLHYQFHVNDFLAQLDTLSTKVFIHGSFLMAIQHIIGHLVP